MNFVHEAGTIKPERTLYVRGQQLYLRSVDQTLKISFNKNFYE